MSVFGDTTYGFRCLSCRVRRRDGLMRVEATQAADRHHRKTLHILTLTRNGQDVDGGWQQPTLYTNDPPF